MKQRLRLKSSLMQATDPYLRRGGVGERGGGETGTHFLFLLLQDSAMLLVVHILSQNVSKCFRFSPVSFMLGIPHTPPFFSCLHFYFNKTFCDLTFKEASALSNICVRDPLGNRTIILHIGPKRKNGYTLNFLFSPDNIAQLIAKKTGGKNKE